MIKATLDFIFWFICLNIINQEELTEGNSSHCKSEEDKRKRQSKPQTVVQCDILVLQWWRASWKRMIDVPLCLPSQVNSIYEQASFVILLLKIGFIEGNFFKKICWTISYFFFILFSPLSIFTYKGSFPRYLSRNFLTFYSF